MSMRLRVYNLFTFLRFVLSHTKRSPTHPIHEEVARDIFCGALQRRDRDANPKAPATSFLEPRETLLLPQEVNNLPVMQRLLTCWDPAAPKVALTRVSRMDA
jgi:hypothetical protein